MMKLHINIFVVFSICFCTNVTYAQIQPKKIDLISEGSDSLYFDSPALFHCNIQLPDNYSLERSFPLVISLHGGGGSYETFRSIWKHFESPQFIMATPQAPYKWLMGDKIGYDWSAWPTGDLTFMVNALKLTSIYIENLIKSLTSKYNVEDVYLLGFSQGSIITQIAGINNHNLLSGIIILSGPELNHPEKPEIVWPEENCVLSANKLKVFIAHGKADAIVDIELARKSKDLYDSLGYDVSLFEFEGGHEINGAVMKEIEIWMKD
jgi:phospholipase/carboxylesterase